MKEVIIADANDRPEKHGAKFENQYTYHGYEAWIYTRKRFTGKVKITIESLTVVDEV